MLPPGGFALKMHTLCNVAPGSLQMEGSDTQCPAVPACNGIPETRGASSHTHTTKHSVQQQRWGKPIAQRSVSHPPVLPLHSSSSTERPLSSPPTSLGQAKKTRIHGNTRFRGGAALTSAPPENKDKKLQMATVQGGRESEG